MLKVKFIKERYEMEQHGDWIDLRAMNLKELIGEDHVEFARDFEVLHYKKGDIVKIGLGVAMKLPEGYEAYLAPRSSTRKHFGLIQTNSIGIIDEAYCGNSDEWQVEFLAVEDGHIVKGDRVCQFRIQKKMLPFEIEVVDELEDENRGGFGSSGRD